MAKNNRKTATTDKTSGKFSMLPLNPLEQGFTVAPALDYVGVHFEQTFNTYEPPINRWALAKLMHQNAQHCGVVQSRANMIANGYLSGALSKMAMRATLQNLLIFGDVGLLKIRNAFGEVLRLEPLSSLYLRVGKDGNFRYLVKKSLYDTELQTQAVEFKAEDVIFIKLYDPMQSIYGLPDYIGGIQSALLNSDATRFRRRYFANGSHLGFILYTTDPDMDEEIEDKLRDNIANSKGVGNFKSMFVNIPGGDPDGLKVIPIGDTGKKDEFGTIKNVSAQDILTAHRFPPGLSGVIPQTGSFGDIEKIRNVYRLDEVLPMQALIADTINTDKEISERLKITFSTEQNVA